MVFGVRELVLMILCVPIQMIGANETNDMGGRNLVSGVQ